MRVSGDLIYDILVKYDRQRNTQLTRKTEELSSGKSILAPSDSPVDFARSLRLKRFSERLDRLNKNIDIISSFLDSAESTVNSAINVLQEARVKFIQLLNTGTITQDDAKTLADYFESLKNYVIKLGNVKVGDSYLFGGVKTQTPPFSSDGTYQGSAQETTVPIAPGVEQNTNFNGENYFAVNKVSNRVLAVEVLDKVIEIIQSGNLNDLHTQEISVDLGDGTKSMKLLDAFDAALSRMMEYRSILGTKRRVTSDLKVQNESMSLRLRELNSELTDTDYPKAIAEYEKAKTAYQALLAAISNVQNISILNFLK
ncbi:flagellar hook-associated protein 3 FlgL [Thermovibrio guaymasensis]|uniref:Flagellar hook-associated protein 3 FlgL n=1 Tax=Thermovibrio guaymasensis TaxID=240167 RepID=A0A420W6M1_9BACT|nr:flagellar hook-associated protein FlgL [Thermovibrio guaymasensis]RKQ61729.1 flagellar hook-associated protein 3 FlgL [Thermovibrio guaymasensis]